MSTKKSFLKNILTTTSALAVIAGASSNATGALISTNGVGNSTIQDAALGVNINPVGNWTANDSFAFKHANNLNLATNGGGVATVATIDVNNQVGRTITSFDASIASIVNSTGVNKVNITVPTAKTLTLGGNNGLQQNGVTVQAAGDFTAAGNFKLGFGNNQAKLVIDINATLGGTINNGNTDNKGYITINAGKVATFNGVIGGTKAVNEINLEGAASKATFNEDVSATKIVTKNAAAEVELADGKTITADVDATAAGGLLTFLGAGEVTGTIGGSNTLTKVKANAAGLVKLSNVTHKATTFETNNANAVIQVAAGGAGKLQGNVDATGNGGQLKFLGAGEVTGTIGATNPLTKVIANGAGTVKLANGTSKATTFETNNANAIIQVAAGGAGKLQGNVDATGNGGQLKFLGAGEVTGTIGATNPLTKITASGGKGADLVLGGVTKAGTLELSSGADVKLGNTTTIDKLTIGDANSHVKITDAKEFILSGAQNTTIEGGADDIVFSGADSKLTFKAEGGNTPIVTINTAALNTGGNNKGKILLFADGDNGGGVDSKLTVRGQAIGGADTFRLVSIGGDKIVRLENEGINSAALNIAIGSKLEYAPSANVSFNTVTFGDATAQMKLEANGANRTFTLNGNLDPGVNDRGTIILHSNGGNIATLTANGGVKTLGTNAHKIHELNATGDSESIITDQVDLTNVITLNVKNDASLNAKSGTAAVIGAINIGEAGGAGTLIIDTSANYNLNNGGNISFKHADSLLKLTNTTVGDKVVTLKGNLTTGNDNEGKVEINSNGTNKLDIAVNAAETIGIAGNNRIKELKISGDQDTTISPEVYAKTITISNDQDVTFEAIVDGGANSTINFTTLGNAVFESNVTATTIAFGDNDRAIYMEDGADLTTQAITSGAGNGSEVIFEGDGNLITGAANNPIALDVIQLGANGKTTTLGAGLYTVTNIEVLHAVGKAYFSDGFQLTGNINNGAGAAGTIKFLGDAKVTGVLGGAGNPVGAVTVAGNNKTLQLGGNVNATSINGNNGGAGHTQTLKFINAGNITVDGTVGNAQAFRTIEFSSGGKVTFNGAGDLTAPTTNFHFSEDNEVVTDGFDIAGANITNIAGKNASKFVVNAAQIITGDIGTSNAERFGELHVNAVGATNVTLNTANFFAGVTGANAKVIFNNGAGSSVSYLGTNAQKINNANFVQNGQVFDAVYANNIDVRDNRVATFNHATFNAALKMHGANARADFASKVTIGSAIEANVGSDGILNFNAGATVNTDIGADGTRLGSTTFAGGDTVINANIYSNAINFGGNTVTLQKDAIFDGLTTFNGTTIELGRDDLTLKGGNSVVTGATEIKTTVNGVDLGNLVVGAGGKITLAGGGNTLKVTVDDAAAVPVDGQALKLIKKEGNGQLDLDLSKLTVDATGAFSKWVTSVDGGELVLKQESQIAEVLEESVRQQGLSEVISQDVLDAIENFEENTPGENFVLQLNQMTKPNIADAVARTTNTTTNEVEKTAFTTMADITNIVNSRIYGISSFANIPTTTPSFGNSVNTNNNIIGVSSGDEHDRYGIWGTPFYSNVTQKKRKSSSGYKSTAYGGTIGFDVKASDDMLVGMAFSAMNSEIKHKDFKSGDKTKVSSYLFTAYGTHQFANNWFGQGVFSIGSNSSDNKENRRVSNTVIQTAQGKYSSMIFSSEVLGGYNHMLNEQLVVSPMFGLNYSRVNSTGYKETGKAGTPLLDVNKQASHQLNLVGGVKLTSAPFIANDVAITPEAHAFVRHDVIGKGAKVNAKLPGLSVLTEKAKLQRTFYNIGAGINAAYGSMDYGVSADANFADKYVGVQGTLKIRVNF